MAPVVIRPLEAEDAAAALHDALHPGGKEQPSISARYICVGQEIQLGDEDGVLRGHGTHLVDGKLIATVCGVVERVDKLVLVKPLKTRYQAAQGDVVVGRVTEVAGKRWKVDLSSSQEAGLLLSAVNLPGGVQRRRNADDELRMREVLCEGDLLSAEVQAVHMDGSVALHTRSAKYGKLAGGQLVCVPPALVKRQKQHFHTLEPSGVHLVLGVNGLLWVAPRPSGSSADAGQDAVTSGAQGSGGGSAAAPASAAPSRDQLLAVVVVGNAIRALARCYLPIFPAAIAAAVELAQERGVVPADMLSPDFLLELVKSEAGIRAAARGGA